MTYEHAADYHFARGACGECGLTVTAELSLREMRMMGPKHPRGRANRRTLRAQIETQLRRLGCEHVR